MNSKSQNFMVGMLVYMGKHCLCDNGCGCDDPNGCGEGCEGTGCGCDDVGCVFDPSCGCDDSCTYEIDLP